MRRAVISLCLAGCVIGTSACETTRDASATSRDEKRNSGDVAAAGTREGVREPTPLEVAVARTVVRELTIPSGTELQVVLDTAIGSDTSRVEQAVRAHLSRAVLVDGETALAEGSTISGVVTEATRSARVKGRAHLAVDFNLVTPRGTDDRYQIQAASISRTAAAETRKDAVTIGAPAAGGAIIGGIVGGGKGAAIGAAAGGGAGTAVVLSTRGREVHLPAGSALRVRLTEPFTIRVSG
jgi:hypothetical protein